jgi:hypothetical protein
MAKSLFRPGKDAILGDEFSRALEDFKAAKKLGGNWKLTAVCFVLRTFPHILRLVYLMRLSIQATLARRF